MFKESSTFSFLGTAEEDVTQSAKSDEKSVEISAKVSKFHKILDDDHQESMDFEESKSDMNKEDISISHRFFFTKDDPRLQSNAIGRFSCCFLPLFLSLQSFYSIISSRSQELRTFIRAFIFIDISREGLNILWVRVCAADMGGFLALQLSKHGYYFA